MKHMVPKVSEVPSVWSIQRFLDGLFVHNPVRSWVEEAPSFKPSSSKHQMCPLPPSLPPPLFPLSLSSTLSNVV